MDKYFIPSIEDIRVGYEYEVRLPKKDWLKETLTKQDLIYIPFLVDSLEKGDMRVPYLTKEQIEAEGWNRGISLYKGDATVELLDNHRIIISQNQTVSFCGECKDINTFRYICKLLNIN